MNVEYKSASIENTGSDDAFPGTFQVVLSTGTKDRDGEEVKREEWQEPLPEHITFDVDHGMSVEKTVGSGRPYFDDAGRLLVDGTYSSLPKAQEVRTLVKEGHIRSTSVAFARHRSTTKGGKTTVTRELLNGAFVAVPANTEAVVLASKAGARNSATDAKRIQAAHDLLTDLGATCAPSDDTGAAEDAVGGKSAKYDADQLQTMLDKGEAIENESGDPSYPIADTEDLRNAIRAVGRGSGDHDKIRAYIIRRAKALGAEDEIPDNWNSDGSVTESKRLVREVAAKAVDGSYEQRGEALYQALQAAYPGDSQWAYTLATFDDRVVYRVSGSGVAAGQYQASYTYENGVATLGEPEKVALVEQVVPMKAYRVVKAAEIDLPKPAAASDPVRLAQAVDASLDEAMNLLDGVVKTDMPEAVAQAIDLATAAWSSAGHLLEALGAYDPDAGEKSADAPTTDTTEGSSDTDAKSADTDALALQYQAFRVLASSLTA